MNNSEQKKPQTGFTLIEILLAVAMISILVGIIIVAINPGRQLAEARDKQRSIDINIILNAFYQYMADHNGMFPGTITGSPTEICRTDAVECSGFIDLSPLVASAYLNSIPVDPTGGSQNSTYYSIADQGGGRISVYAPYTETGLTLEITR